VSDEQPDTPHVPPPSLWPIGFAIGVACILVGLVVSIPALIVVAAGLLTPVVLRRSAASRAAAPQGPVVEAAQEGAR